MRLADYLQKCAGLEDLTEIQAPVATDQELAAISRREFANNNGGKALLFNQPWPGKFSAVSNLFGSEKRMAGILRSESLGDFEDKVNTWLSQSDIRLEAGALSFPSPHSLLKPTDQYSLSSYLSDIPALKSWPEEKKPYFSLALTLTRHPQTGQQNIGLYRIQVVDDHTLAINLSPSSGAQQHLNMAAELGEDLPVCLVLGCDPLLMWAAAAPLPDYVDELDFCRHFFNEDFPLVSIDGLPFEIPESAELIIAGTLKPGQCGDEGPFGNHTGAYVSRSDCPYMQVSAVQHKENPLIPFTVVGPPPSENIWLAKVNEIWIRALLKRQFDLIQDVFMPITTIFHGVTIISVKCTCRADVKNLINALWKNGPLQRAKLIVIVDENINPSSLEQSWWYVINRLSKVNIYRSQQRMVIDASGIDIGPLVTESHTIANLISKRSGEQGYYPF